MAQSQQFYDALKAKGVKTELVILPDVEHSWIGKTPESARSATKSALAKTMDFVEATIGDSTKRK